MRRWGDGEGGVAVRCEVRGREGWWVGEEVRHRGGRSGG